MNVPIFVLLFWIKVVNPSSGEVAIEDVDLIAAVSSPQACIDYSVLDAVKKTGKDGVQHIGDGLVPKIVCGLPVPEQKRTTPPGTGL